MTACEHADLAALQHEVSGSNEPLLPPNDDQDKHTELPGEEWEDVEDEEDEDSTADKPISREELGLPPRGSKWSDRVANEHQAWVGQISVLCDAYLAYRAGESPLELESDDENHMVKVFCVDITGTFALFKWPPPTDPPSTSPLHVSNPHFLSGGLQVVPPGEWRGIGQPYTHPTWLSFV
ncbi:hypothetical protein FRC08_003357 [Ceratobasidium sp. 394]|nr:hypothetical protein FRC08_003357 [Ceratobasidium sp. 394]